MYDGFFIPQYGDNLEVSIIVRSIPAERITRIINPNNYYFLRPYTWQKNYKKGLFRFYIQTLLSSYKERKTHHLIDPSYALESVMPFVYF